jgi:8-oxo-dGTP diphosphatase
MSDERFRAYVAVFLLLKRGEEVFLVRRFQTGYMDGMYTLPSGHVEEDELPIQTAIREAKEEVGVDVAAEEISFEHVLFQSRSDRTYVDLFFSATKWTGEPKNNEPEKCDACLWARVDALPPETLEYVKRVLGHASSNIRYGEEYAPAPQPA